jgi:hypothetical protein
MSADRTEIELPEHLLAYSCFERFPMPPALADSATTIGAGGSRTSRMEDS